MPLAEIQARVRDAIVDGRTAQLHGVLTGGRDPLARFSVHRRHYEASLVRVLAGKFPALVWLAGSPFVTEAARAFVRLHPPRAPCIAEYGEEFPAFLAEAGRFDWLRSTGELEWRLGRAAVAVEYRPIGVQALQAVDPRELGRCTLAVQPGLSYLAAAWPVDRLVALFLSDQAPPSYAFDPEDVFLEVCGARGAFTMTRLDAATFTFRRALARGAAIASAAEQALEADPAFDAGQGLLQLIATGLVTGFGGTEKDMHS
ncbi:MAG: putative DNA-binding domain-containing protein [Pseudolabrys sp.]